MIGFSQGFLYIPRSPSNMRRGPAMYIVRYLLAALDRDFLALRQLIIRQRGLFIILKNWGYTLSLSDHTLSHVWHKKANRCKISPPFDPKLFLPILLRFFTRIVIKPPAAQYSRNYLKYHCALYDCSIASRFSYLLYLFSFILRFCLHLISHE